MKTLDIKIKLSAIIDSIVRRKCLLCNRDLDKELGQVWHIPLCKKHRKESLNEIMEERGELGE